MLSLKQILVRKSNSSDSSKVSAITGLYWSEDDDSNDLSDWHERDVNPLWPYWYARWFDEENKQFHIDEDMEVIPLQLPKKIEQMELNSVKKCLLMDYPTS